MRKVVCFESRVYQDCNVLSFPLQFKRFLSSLAHSSAPHCLLQNANAPAQLGGIEDGKTRCGDPARCPQDHRQPENSPVRKEHKEPSSDSPVARRGSTYTTPSVGWYHPSNSAVSAGHIPFTGTFSRFWQRAARPPGRGFDPCGEPVLLLRKIERSLRGVLGAVMRRELQLPGHQRMIAVVARATFPGRDSDSGRDYQSCDHSMWAAERCLGLHRVASIVHIAGRI